jgi:hypothetical protein
MILALALGGQGLPGCDDAGPAVDAGSETLAIDAPPADGTLPDLSPVDGPAGATLCPAQEPVQKDPCPQFALRCSYGDALLPGCRVLYGCGGREVVAWRLTAAEPRCADPAAGCPASPPGPDDPPAAETECAYADGTVCIYAAILGSDCSCGDVGWTCTPPPAGCPGRIPNAGAPCGQAGQECIYEPVHCPFDAPDTLGGFSVTCREGIWTWTTPTCAG